MVERIDRASRLHEISEALYRIASGDFDVDLPVSPGMDEIDAVARGVSMLAEEIGAQVHDMEHYRDIVENQAVGIALVDEREGFVFANQAAHLIFGVPYDRLVGRNLREFTDEEQYQVLLEQTEQRRLGTRSTYELEIRRPDGDRRVIRLTSTPRFDPGECFRGALGIFNDITEFRQVEELEGRHLRDMAFLSEAAIDFVALSYDEDIYALIGEKIQDLVDDAFVFVLTYDETRERVFSRVVLGEEKRLAYAVRVLGWDFRDIEFAVNPELKERLVTSGLLRMPGGLHELLNPTMPNEMWSRLWESFRLGELYIMAIKHREDIFGAVVIITPGDKRVDNPDLVEAFVYQAAVAVQRRKVEEELRESELMLRRITTAMQDMVGQFDMDGVYRYISPSCEAVTGFGPEHYIGRYIFEFVHPDDLVEATAEFIAARAEARPGKVEYRTRHADGRWIWLESLGNPIFNEKGELAGAIFSNRDITNRRRWEREIERMNRELKVYDHTVSHDLKSPLSSVKIAVSTLKTLAESSEDNQQQMEEVVGIIERTIDKINSLLDGLLEMAETSDRNVKLEEVDLGEMVRDILSELAGTTYGASYRVNNLGRIKANPVHMYQLFSNLIRNAMKYANNRAPEISILKISNHCFLVKDNGSGIPGYLEDSLFMPFVKGDEGGRGLGLSIVKRIVETYGGEIRANNDDEGGACFEFTLYDIEPAAEA